MAVVEGLKTGLYINNPIYARVTDTDLIYVDVQIEETADPTNRVMLRFWTHNEIAEFNIASSVKALFPHPESPTGYMLGVTEIEFRNSVMFDVFIEATYQSGFTSTVYQQSLQFIRGGKYGDFHNISAIKNTPLLLTDKVPFWNGFPNARYKMNNDYEIEKTPFAGAALDVDVIRVKTCYSVYVKWLNRLGGYSYWLFEVGEDEMNAKSLGAVTDGWNQTALGSEVTIQKNLNGKVPIRYVDLIRDLFASPEIYLYEEGLVGGFWGATPWARVYLGDNKWLKAGDKFSYKYNITLKQFNLYEPALL